MAPIRTNVSLYNRYPGKRVGSVEPFRTYYIIMEGTNTEPDYFRLLEKRLSDLKIRNNIRIVYLERTQQDRGSNSPRQLFRFLQDFRKCQNDKAAVYCMVFDRDSYKNQVNPTEGYLNFLNQNQKSKIRMIVSSPCFEVWLLLHQKNSVSDIIEPNAKPIFENARLTSSFTYISKMVRDVFGFNPKIMIPEHFLDRLPIAMSQAHLLTTDLHQMATEIGQNVSEFIAELQFDPRKLS
ncbi:MAG TPA: hypothetical protein DD618_03525 [Acholeplasmatales bacterium]|nr:hypothetical protein [Acholeplasmatales bacterium]